MRRSSAAADAIICSFRSMSPIGTKALVGDGLAETWVQAAIAAGCNPHMRQEPLSRDGLAGEWLLFVSKTGLNHPLYPGELRPPAGLVLEGREHGGMMDCAGGSAVRVRRGV